MFSKDLALLLPSRRPHDRFHRPPPRFCTSSRSTPQPERQRGHSKHISDSLAAGLIRPSSSQGRFLLCWERNTRASTIALTIEDLTTEALKTSIRCLSFIPPEWFSPHPHHRRSCKTALHTPTGHLAYRVMSPGLTNEPALFPALTSDLLWVMPSWFVFDYLSYILFFFSWRTHTTCSTGAPMVTGKQPVSQSQKWEFHEPSVSVLGCIIGKRQPRPGLSKHMQPASTTHKQLRHFLGFDSFYRRFSRDYLRLPKLKSLPPLPILCGQQKQKQH